MNTAKKAARQLHMHHIELKQILQEDNTVERVNSSAPQTAYFRSDPSMLLKEGNTDNIEFQEGRQVFERLQVKVLELFPLPQDSRYFLAIYALADTGNTQLKYCLWNRTTHTWRPITINALLKMYEPFEHELLIQLVEHTTIV